MIKLASLWFRTNKATWTKEKYDYYFDFPEDAYLTKAEAEKDLPADEVVVSFDEMAGRIAEDIHHDA